MSRCFRQIDDFRTAQSELRARGPTSDTPADGDAVPSADAEDGELEDGQVPDAGIDVKALQHMLTGTLNGFR